MTQAVSRFLTFDLGKGDIAKQQKTFFHVSQYPVAYVNSCGVAVSWHSFRINSKSDRQADLLWSVGICD